MRVLVIGGSGLIGSHLMREAARLGHHVSGTFRAFPSEGLIQLDLRDEPATDHLLDRLTPDWVVHAAGWTWVDGCEKDPLRAMDENCHQPARLAIACRKRGIRYAYVSTTYIFDGKDGPYDEKARPRPINVYGQAKFQAEQAIQRELGGQALLPRLICAWGVENQKKNFVYQVIASLRAGQRMRLPSDQFGNPSWAGDIAFWLLGLMERGQSGIWNLAGAEVNCSRIEWFCAIREALRSKGLLSKSGDPGYEAVLTSKLGQKALRPLHAGAIIQKIASLIPVTPRPPLEIDGIIENEFGRNVSASSEN